MIECRSCKFTVKQNMRHALSNNCCPACGSALLGDLHKRRLDLFKNKLTNQHFARNLDSNDIFDIALFMLVEFFPPTAPEQKEDAPEGQTADEAVEDTSASESPPEESYEDVRSQVRDEMVKSSETISAEDIDEDLRIQRLKRIAKENRLKTGAAVRRVDS
tara:strand:- start:17297 stop:17779 length:483 start_codon:yes stop_codon:yes gene_type:complete